MRRRGGLIPEARGDQNMSQRTAAKIFKADGKNDESVKSQKCPTTVITTKIEETCGNVMNS
jgi:hypothetical protein